MIVSQTLLESKESLSTKIDAVALLCCIIVKYPEAYKRNEEIYRNIFENESKIIASNSFPFSSNIDNIALTISLRILFSAMDLDVNADLLELLPYLKDNVATTISVTNFIAGYLESSPSIVFPKQIETTIGIRYFSCASIRASDMGFNYVFPASGKHTKESFCPTLSRAFKLTKPYFLHEYRDIYSCEDALRKDNNLDFI